jgi:hypothetical protein
MRAVRLTHLILLYLITHKLLGDEKRLWSISLRNFLHSLVAFSFRVWYSHPAALKRPQSVSPIKVRIQV